MTTLQFTGKVESPAPSNCPGVCAGDASSLTLELEPVVAEFAEVVSGNLSVNSVAYEQLMTPGEVPALRFLALTLDEGETAPVDVLLGHAPQLLGVGGVYPLTGSGGLTVTLVDMTTQGGSVRFTVATTLQVGDTAVQAAARVNAAAMLAGLLEPLARVAAGQLVITGDLPGARQALDVTVTNAAAGLPTAGRVLGRGEPLSVDRDLVISLPAAAALSGEDVWLRGGLAAVRFVAAGTL